MRPSRRNIIIATRSSQLARAQSEAVGQYLQSLNPRVQVEYIHIESDGDKVRNHPLAAIGGKGLFTRNIEHALLTERADIAIHSYKDLPTEDTPGLVVAATPGRRDPNDVLVSPHGQTLDALPQGASVGTCSSRRGAQLLKLRPDLQVSPLRGNVDTRIRKIYDEKLFDATLLALAGLQRLGINEYDNAKLSADDVLPACAQGALAIQCRADDHVTIRRLLPLNDAVTNTAITAERMIANGLNTDCHSPIAALAEQVDLNLFRIRVRILSTDGTTCLEADKTTPTRHVRKTCDAIINDLIKDGAAELLAKATHTGMNGTSQSQIANPVVTPATLLSSRA